MSEFPRTVPPSFLKYFGVSWSLFTYKFTQGVTGKKSRSRIEALPTEDIVSAAGAEAEEGAIQQRVFSRARTGAQIRGEAAATQEQVGCVVGCEKKFLRFGVAVRLAPYSLRRCVVFQVRVWVPREASIFPTQIKAGVAVGFASTTASVETTQTDARAHPLGLQVPRPATPVQDASRGGEPAAAAARAQNSLARAQVRGTGSES